MYPHCSKLFAPAILGFAFGVTLFGAKLQVATDKGNVEGTLTADRKVIAFKGIPFAAPPVGNLRWQPPQALAAWKGVRKAQEFGSHCYQSISYGDMVFHDPGPSEDCLTLNVWTPAGAKRGSLPVMVWIYGGGFAAGGTSEGRQNGEFLPRHGVVVVSMNYRLGIFGFFSHPELTAESPHHASGNYGLMDVAAALQWVKANIAGFGGDPANVTIFGESAGSFAVSAELASPLSKDLVARAIGESGGAFFSGGLSFDALAATEAKGADFAKDHLHAATLTDLRKMSASDVLAAATAKSTPAPPRFGPNVDGYFLPASVPSIYAAGKQARVPLLAGWNADEGRGAVLSAKTKPTAESFARQAETDFGAEAPRFIAAYGAKTDADAETAAGDFAGDRFIAYSTWRWLEAQVQTGGSPVYRYFFELGSPGDKNHQAAMGAFHSDEIEYVFGALDSRPGAAWRPEDRKLSDLMGSYWTNFARSGDPNGPGLPPWPKYEAADQWQTMHLDANAGARPDTHRDRYLFLDSVWGADRKEHSGQDAKQ